MIIHCVFLLHDSYFTATDVENYMISAPCHGAVLGAWLGAWPMPLDWERPWQVKIPSLNIKRYAANF
jgi:hypothetical protein